MKTYIIIVMAFLGLAAQGQSLEEYMFIAADNNPGLKAQHKLVEASMAKVAQAGSLMDPKLSFGYFISPVETRVGPQQAKIGLSQMFPWFGTLKTKEQQASLMAEAQYAKFVDLRNELFYKVAAAYYPLQQLETTAVLEAENIRLLTSYKEIAQLKFENNKGSLVDVLRVDLMLKESQSNLEIIELQKTPLISKFNSLLNRPLDTEIVIATEQETPQIPQLKLDWENHPLMISKDLQIKAAEQGKALSEKAGKPNFGVGLDYVFVQERTDMVVPNNGQNAIMPMASMSLPIFRKKYKEAQKEADLRWQAQVLQKEDLSNQLESKQKMILANLQSQLQLLDLYEAQIKETSYSLELLFTAYSNSSKEFEEVLRMQQMVLMYKKQQAKALSKALILLEELNYLQSNRTS